MLSVCARGAVVTRRRRVRSAAREESSLRDFVAHLPAHVRCWRGARRSFRSLARQPASYLQLETGTAKLFGDALLHNERSATVYMLRAMAALAGDKLPSPQLIASREAATRAGAPDVEQWRMAMLAAATTYSLHADAVRSCASPRASVAWPVAWRVDLFMMSLLAVTPLRPTSPTPFIALPGSMAAPLRAVCELPLRNVARSPVRLALGRVVVVC